MSFRVVFSRLIVALAICGVLSSPLARQALAGSVIESASAAQEDVSKSAMDEMPCCPDMTPLKDCVKTCALMAMCATPFACLTSSDVRQAIYSQSSKLLPAAGPVLAGLDTLPRPKPPKAAA